MKKYIILIVLTIILGSLPLFIQYGNYVFISDYFYQLMPFIMETKRMFSSGVPFWSWNTFFGDNFIATYSYYTFTSPFVWINCLFPTEWIVYSIFFTLILKYICIFLSAYFYLRRINVSTEYAKIGGLLYAFSSFSISNSGYYLFFEPVIMFPILLIAIERFLDKEKYSKTTLILAAFLTTFINYYFSVCSFIAAAIYVLCRVWFSEEREKYLKKIPSGICLILIGILMNCFILFPTAVQLSGSERVTDGLHLDILLKSFICSLERLRVLFMLQPIEKPTSLFIGTGWNSCSATLPVAGIFFALLYCLKNSKSWISYLLLISIVFFLTPLNSVFSLLKNPTYTRWAYALTLFFIIATVKWLEDSKNKISLYRKYLLLYIFAGFGVYCFALLCGFLKPSNFNYSHFIAYTVLFIVSITCLIIYIYSSYSNKILLYGILFCASIQMISLHILGSDIGFAYNKDNENIDLIKTYFLDNTLPENSKEYVMQYRTAFEERYRNSALLKNRPSVSGYNSVLNANLHKFVKIADTSLVKFVNRVKPKCYRRPFYSLMSVKEAVHYNDPYLPPLNEKMNYTLTDSTKNYIIYQNNDYIPMGFCYDTYIKESDIDSLLTLYPKPNIPLVMLSNIVVSDQHEEVFSSYLDEGEIDFLVNIDSVINKRRENASISFYGDTRGFVSKVNLARKNFVFFSVPADKGFTAYVDGEEVEIYKVNLGLSAILVPQGVHEIKFNYCPKGLKEGLAISLIFLILTGFIYWREARNEKSNNDNLEHHPNN